MNIDGTDGDDDLAGSAGIDLIFGFGGNDTLRGSADADTLFGGDGNDVVYGGTGNDRLFGGAGNDLLNGGVAPDEPASGAAEWNAAVYDFSAWSTSVVFPDYPPGFDPLALPPDQIPDGQGGMDTLVLIHQLEIYGGSAADQLSGVHLQGGLAGFTFIEGNGGDDVIGHGAGLSTVAFDTARRDLGVDTLQGFASGDRILLRNFDFDLARPLATGDGSAAVRGEVQFSYDAGTNLTRVFVGADDVAGADVRFDLVGQFQASRFSRNDAGTDAYLVLDEGRSDPVQPQVIVGTDGNDDLAGGGGNDSISGGAGHDVLAGGGGDDTLRGEGGNDHLKGGAGNDLLDAGADYDAAVYDFTAWSTAVSFTGTLDPTVGATSTQADGLGGIDTLVNIETMEIYGGSADDTLVGSSAIDFLEGGAGNDLLTGGAGVDTFGFETQGADVGVDLITDLSREDRIRLRHLNIDFDKSVSTGDGTAVTRGEAQVSAYDATTDTTHLYVGTDDVAGADLVILLQGNRAAEDFSLMSANLPGMFYSELIYMPMLPPPPADAPRTFTGSELADTYTGGPGHDTISGGAGNDTLMGEGGNDRIDGEAGNDKLYGGDGHDTISGGLGRDRLEGGAGNDLLSGDDGDDMIWGDDGFDWILGGAGNDRLTGGAGDDFLLGGAGSDILVGNAGVDTFQFESGSGTDRIDFFWVSHRDRIRIQSDVNGSGIFTAQDAYAHTSDTVDGALIDLGAGNTVLLTGVHLDALSPAIFEIF